ncbi:MAG: hypothetical protein ACREEP_21595 [Dongiaceae bacterium]
MKPRRLVILTILAVTVGAFFKWQWLVAIGVAPIILAVLPCGIMCALGMCMMPKRRAADGKDATDSNPADIGTLQQSAPQETAPVARGRTE